MNNYIQVKKINKRYEDKVVFENLNIDFQKNAVNFIMGPSGIGKTTLLRILMGLEDIDEGEILGMEGLKKSAVFQEDRLCENLTTMANIKLPVNKLSKPEKAKFTERAIDLLEILELSEYVGKKVSQLSGGQKRRVAILRGALAPCDIIFFDEPMQGIDEESKERLMEAIAPIIKGKTVFWVTHNIEELKFFDKPNIINL